MVVRVLVNQSTRAPDKLYDYLVPEEHEGKILIGSRLKVPFGAQNKELEAYVFDIRKGSRAAKLKSIISVYDRVFDENMLALIKWLRDECVCTYIDVIKTVVPAGSVNKPEEWFELCGGSDNPIAKALAENGGMCESTYLMAMFEKDISAQLRKLLEQGVIKRIWRDHTEVAERRVRMAEAAVDTDELEDVIAQLRKRRAWVQARMLEILADAQNVSVSDLVRFSEGSYAAFRALVKKGLARSFEVTVMRKPVTVPALREEKKNLTAEQKLAFDALCAAVDAGEYSQFLLHGVTGSGKTEVFLQTIDKCISMGKKAIMLVPEISLTPQMVSRFSARFGERIALLHSGLSLGERYDEWRRIRDGAADIIIGARSAIFAPCDNIGIIIMDEEHEQSYKSEMQPRYNTHDIARFRARQNGAALLLASATPRVESYYDATHGGMRLLTLKKRFNENAMPEVSVVDMRKELQSGNRSILSKQLRQEIEKNLENGEQTILFLNRRGFSTFVSCRSCGYVANCPHCSISLTYHKFSDTLRCHYCGYTIPNYTKCPSCGSGYIRYFGGGTQKVQEEIATLFPGAKTLRMDNDTTSGKNGHERILNEFVSTGADILIGTQMVAKGLDFPNVTLVGVISADTSLNVDDFRSAERTFALLEQVVGRAGRAEKLGRAVIQTYTPEHPAVVFAKQHDYLRFYGGEIGSRKALWYPPYCTMTSIGFSGRGDQITSECAKCFAKAFALHKIDTVRVMGPIRASVSKIKNKYRYQIIIKAPRGSKLTAVLAQCMEKCRANKNFDDVAIVVDQKPNTIY